MFTKTLVIGSALALSMMFTLPAWSGNGPGNGNDRQPMADSADCVAGLPYEDVSEAEIAGLRHMREEEKLARDIYMAFNDLWGHWTFANIMRSEQTHMEKVGQLLVKYQIPDPITVDTPGVFSDETLRSLYVTLLEKGKVSLIEALRVGATIEDLDIFDLKRELILADNEDIKTVYQNLMKGSRNHLRAFVYQLSLPGEVYVPQYLTRDELQAIVAAAPERGPVDENGSPIDAGDRTGSKMRDRINIENADADCVVGDD
ncbi:MAG: DUF2202 domain-containing protein [Pseudomonadota bacterium]